MTINLLDQFTDARYEDSKPWEVIEIKGDDVRLREVGAKGSGCLFSRVVVEDSERWRKVTG